MDSALLAQLEKGLTLLSGTTEQVPKLPDQPLSYIVSELAKNALDAVYRAQTGQEVRAVGSARLDVRRAGDRILLEFSDTGAGAVQVAGRPGEFGLVPAFRDRTGRGAQLRGLFGGQGVGLLWSKLLIESRGGTIEFLNGAVPGYSTTVRVTLPAAAVRAGRLDEAPVKPYDPGTVPPPGMVSNLGARLSDALVQLLQPLDHDVLFFLQRDGAMLLLVLLPRFCTTGKKYHL